MKKLYLLLLLTTYIFSAECIKICPTEYKGVSLKNSYTKLTYDSGIKTRNAGSCTTSKEYPNRCTPFCLDKANEYNKTTESRNGSGFYADKISHN